MGAEAAMVADHQDRGLGGSLNGVERQLDEREMTQAIKIANFLIEKATALGALVNSPKGWLQKLQSKALAKVLGHVPRRLDEKFAEFKIPEPTSKDIAHVMTDLWARMARIDLRIEEGDRHKKIALAIAVREEALEDLAFVGEYVRILKEQLLKFVPAGTDKAIVEAAFLLALPEIETILGIKLFQP